MKTPSKPSFSSNPLKTVYIITQNTITVKKRGTETQKHHFRYFLSISRRHQSILWPFLFSLSSKSGWTYVIHCYSCGQFPCGTCINRLAGQFYGPQKSLGQSYKMMFLIFKYLEKRSCNGWKIRGDSRTFAVE